MALEVTTGDPQVQEAALRFLANMSVDGACRKLLRDKTNSLNILASMSQRLEGEALELCQLALSNLNVFDPNEKPSRKSTFRGTRPNTASFVPTAADDRKSSDIPLKIAYPGDPRFVSTMSKSRSESTVRKNSSAAAPSFAPPTLHPDDIVDPTAASPTSPDAQAAPNSPARSSSSSSSSVAATTQPADPTAGMPALPPVPSLAPGTDFTQVPGGPPSPAWSSAAATGSLSPRNLADSPLSPRNLSESPLPPRAANSGDAETSAKMLKQREEVAQELLLTETAYVATLNALQSTFFIPLVVFRL